MRPKIGEGADAANPKILLAFQERIYLLLELNRELSQMYEQTGTATGNVPQP